MQKTIAVFSKKHGVGCSTLAWNLGLLLNKKIYEADSGLLHFFGQVRAQNKDTNFYVDKISNVKQFKNSGIYDCGNHLSESTLRNILKSSDVVIVPSYYDHITLLNTVASLKIIHEINPYTKVIIVFNRLTSLGEDRERSYTSYALKRLKKMVSESNIQFILHERYIRQNFAYFRFFEAGKYFLDHFFSPEELEDRMLNSIIDNTDEDRLITRQQLALDNIKHLENINYLYFRKNEPAKTTKALEIRDEDIYSKDAINNSNKVTRDIYELIKAING